MDIIVIIMMVTLGLAVYAICGITVGAYIESERSINQSELAIIILWPIEIIVIFTHGLVRGIKREFRYWRATWGK